jgi:RimJ/RimL family protein N-acetyltransferase
MTNYDKKNSHIFYLLYELFELAKKNNIDIVNLGACSTNGGKEILYSKYTFKSSCGCSPIMKYSFSYIKDMKFETNRLCIKKMTINEQYLISYFWQNNKYASEMFFLKENIFNYNTQINWYNNIKKDSTSIYFSIFDNEKLNFIGYCGIKNTNDCELFIVILDNNYYKKGFGKESFQGLINYTENIFPGKIIYLNVKKSNKNAIEMYKKLNFMIDSENNNLIKMILTR